MLTVCASSTTEQLTTAQAVMEMLGTTTTSCASYFAQVDGMVTRASAAVQAFVGYPLLAASYQETVPAYGGLELRVSRTPIRAVLRVFDATDTGTATELTSTEYRVDDPGAGLLQRDEGFAWTAGSHWELDEYVVPGSELKSWLIEYAAGYVGPLGTASTEYGSTATARDLPYDIEAAVIETAKSMYLGRARDSNVSSKRIGDLALTYTSESVSGAGAGVAYGIPPTAVQLLRPYRRLA